MSDPAQTVQANIPEALAQNVADALAGAREEKVAERVRSGDATLWDAPRTPEVANRLGWLDVARRMENELAELETFAQDVKDDGIEDVLLLGMGGSSLAPEVLARSFGQVEGWPRLRVLDSTDAGAVLETQRAVNMEHTLFVVSSKSGGTIEPLSMLAHFWPLVGERGSRLVAITDPDSGLGSIARERGFRRVFAGDPNIGGRYSALSPFGIVPAALAGYDVRALLDGAKAAWDTPLASEHATDVPTPIWVGIALSALARAGKDKLTFIVPGGLSSVGLWQEQLVAESTGKHGKGILPVADEPLGEVEAYGDDRVFAYLPDVGGAGTAEQERTDARVRELIAAGHPTITIPTNGPQDLGRVFLLSELIVATTGWGLGINPFDQPDVQRAKDATNRVLDEFKRTGALPAIAEIDPQADPDGLRALLADASPPSYVAIMGYVKPSAAFDQAVAELRETIRDATKATTTFGYGPRFLHSTGQFHKGGPKTGRFLQLVHDSAEDAEIPGKPYGFETLKNAQADGDLKTLRELELPAERVRLRGEDPAMALREITGKIKEAVMTNASGNSEKRSC